jgi:hypothetical protein
VDLASGLLFFSVLHYGCCRLKKQMAPESRFGMHAYNNPAVQPNEELAVRGFSMYKGQEVSK